MPRQLPTELYAARLPRVLTLRMPSVPIDACHLVAAGAWLVLFVLLLATPTAHGQTLWIHDTVSTAHVSESDHGGATRPATRPVMLRIDDQHQQNGTQERLLGPFSPPVPLSPAPRPTVVIPLRRAEDQQAADANSADSVTPTLELAAAENGKSRDSRDADRATESGPGDVSLATRADAAPTSASATDPSGPSDGESTADAPTDGSADLRVPLTEAQLHLKRQIEDCLRFYFDRPLDTQSDSPWSVMHSFLGFGAETTLAIGGPQGRRLNAIGWLCWNRPSRNMSLLYLDQRGRVAGREGPGYQGHPGQFLAMLAQCRIQPTYEIRIGQQRRTIQDLIDAEKLTCHDGTELTFKLIALSHYLTSESQWENDRGQSWDIPKLIRAELASPINGAACGGTHRIMGISRAVYHRYKEGLPIDGQWARAAKYVRDYHRYTFSLQNRDGSFSSDWFKGRANWGGIDRQLQTTGHIVEWLVFSLPDDELHDPRLVNSVRFLTGLMTANRYHDWEVGPRGHAIRALRLYHQRALHGSSADWLPTRAARTTATRR